MSTEFSRRDALNLAFGLGALTLVGGAAMAPARVSAQTPAQPLPYIPHAVRAPDGVMLNVQERGNLIRRESRRRSIRGVAPGKLDKGKSFNKNPLGD